MPSCLLNLLSCLPTRLSGTCIVREKEREGTDGNDVYNPTLVLGTRFAVPGYVWIALGYKSVVFGQWVGFCAGLYPKEKSVGRMLDRVVGGACLFVVIVWQVGGSRV
jgi:hypothetical protein